MNYREYLALNFKFIPISLILILVVSRLIPHPPNFTPVVTVAIMSGYFFKDKFFSISVLLISMLLSDLFIGFHKNMIFVYLSLVTITLIFQIYFKKLNHKNLIIYGFLGSLTFFLISNFGVWLIGDLYQKNLNGIIECYYMALPFFKNTIFSTFFFSYLVYFANYLMSNFYQKIIKNS